MRPLFLPPLSFSAYSSIRTHSSTRLLIRRYAYANVAALPWAQIQFHRKKDERSVCRPTTDITPIRRRRKKREKWIWISLSCFFPVFVIIHDHNSIEIWINLVLLYHFLAIFHVFHAFDSPKMKRASELSVPIHLNPPRRTLCSSIFTQFTSLFFD